MNKFRLGNFSWALKFFRYLISDHLMDYYFQAALKEAYRVLRSGGRIMILEFSHVQNPLLRQIYDTYSFNVIPRIGGLVANDSESYQYLVESIRRFPTQVNSSSSTFFSIQWCLPRYYYGKYTSNFAVINVKSSLHITLKDDLLLMVKDAGFVCTTYTNMSFGVVAIHTGFKL